MRALADWPASWLKSPRSSGCNLRAVSLIRTHKLQIVVGVAQVNVLVC